MHEPQEPLRPEYRAYEGLVVVDPRGLRGILRDLLATDSPHLAVLLLGIVAVVPFFLEGDGFTVAQIIAVASLGLMAVLMALGERKKGWPVPQRTEKESVDSIST